MAFEPEYWRRLQAEVIQPLAELLANSAAAEGTGGQSQLVLQRAVAAAQALATRKCAHPRCTTVIGPSEAAMHRGKLCSGCRLVCYCGVACQKADWRAHKAACRELLRLQGSSSQ